MKRLIDLFIVAQAIGAVLAVALTVWVIFWLIAWTVDAEACTNAGMRHQHTTITFDGYCLAPGLVVVPVEEVVGR